MLGRAAYQHPWLLADVDRRIFGAPGNPVANRMDAAERMTGYIEQRLAQGDYMTRITRHMLGLLSCPARRPAVAAHAVGRCPP